MLWFWYSAWLWLNFKKGNQLFKTNNTLNGIDFVPKWKEIAVAGWKLGQCVN